MNDKQLDTQWRIGIIEGRSQPGNPIRRPFGQQSAEGLTSAVSRPEYPLPQQEGRFSAVKTGGTTGTPLVLSGEGNFI
jgi:hypothetical protein